MKTNRIILRLEVTPEAKAALEDVTERAGMTQVAVASRTMEWMAMQPATIQAAILGHYPAEVMPDVAKMILDKMVF